MRDAKDRAREINAAASKSVRARIEAEKVEHAGNLELLGQFLPRVEKLCRQFARSVGWQLTKDESRWEHSVCTTFKMSEIAVYVNATPGYLSNLIRGITIGPWRLEAYDHFTVDRVEIPFDEFSEAAFLEGLTEVAAPLVEWEKYQHERGKNRNRRFFRPS